MKLNDETTYSKIFHYLALILFSGLFLVGLVVTGINYEVYSEFPTLEANNLFSIFVMLVLAGLLFLGLSKLYDRCLKNVSPWIITLTACILSYALSALWILSAKAVPQADQLTLYYAARDINNGTIEPMTETSYLVFFPYQLGFVSFLRILIKIFGEGNFTAYQLVLGLCSPIIVASGSGIVKHISAVKDTGKARFLYCFLMLLCVPMYFYTTFIYGDLPFAALSLVCIYLALECMERPSVFKVVLFFFSCGLDYLVKTNALIVFAALAIYFLLSLFKKEKRIRSIVLLVTMLAGAFLINKVNQTLYSDLIPDQYDSLPFIASVVMGMNDDYSDAGWCNFYHQNVFVENNCNAADTAVQCKADLKAALGYWAKHPLYMLDFFYRKINLQWNTPLYQALVMNSTHDAETQNALGHAVYDDQNVHLGLQYFMKAYQLATYGLTALALLLTRKKKHALKAYLPLIAVFGSFLFSLMWESKTRYQMPAFLMLIPAMAVAVPVVYDWFLSLPKKKMTAVLSEAEQGPKQYNGIDLFKFIMALFVIAIHVLPHISISGTAGYEAVDDLINIAVPFFFLASGYLIGQKCKKAETTVEKCGVIKASLWKMLKLYLIWSLIYLPIYVVYAVENQFTVTYAVTLYLKEFFFQGDHYLSYILWYLLASVWALLLLWGLMKKNVSDRILLVTAMGVMALALTFDSLADAEDLSGLALKMHDLLHATIGNGRILYGFFYMSLGLLFCSWNRKLSTGILTAVFGYLMSLTGIFEGVGIIVTAAGIFMVARNISLKDSPVWKWLRNLSTGTYFIHLYVWIACYMLVYGTRTFGLGIYAMTTAVSLLLAGGFFAVKGKLKLGKVSVDKLPMNN